jgi:hypothetical protein
VKVWGVREAEIRAAASEAGLAIYNEWGNRSGITKDGNALRFRLKVDPTKPRDENGMLPFQARGRSWGDRRGRRLPSVTWEGHREFMRILFRDHPDARLKSAIADYKGRADFWAKHPETKGKWSGPGY